MTHLQSHDLSDGVLLPPKPALLPSGRYLTTKSSSFGRQQPVSVNSLHVAFSDGSFFHIPSATDSDDLHTAQRYSAAVHAIQADPRKFLSSSKCAVCEGTSHPFADCEVLNDIEFLKKHHVAYCVNQRRLKKKMITRAAVNELIAAINDEDSPDPNFHQGEQ